MADAPAATGADPAPQSTEAVAETTARLYGWTPKEQFTGNPANWVPATAYVDRIGKRFPGLFDSVDRVVRAQTETQSSMRAMEQQLQQTQATMDDLREFARRANEAGFQRGLAEANQRLATARAAGDVDAVETASREVATLEAERARVAPRAGEPPARTDPPPRQDPPRDQQQPQRLTPEEQATVTTWVDQNKWWYLANARLKMSAEGILSELNATRPDLNLQQKLDLVREKTRTAFPEDFGGTRDDMRPAAVLAPGGGTTAAPAAGRRTFDDLPDDAKAAFARYERELSRPGKPYTKEEYLNAYVWD